MREPRKGELWLTQCGAVVKILDPSHAIPFRFKEKIPSDKTWAGFPPNFVSFYYTRLGLWGGGESDPKFPLHLTKPYKPFKLRITE